jgi:hypothetical protein
MNEGNRNGHIRSKLLAFLLLLCIAAARTWLGWAQQPKKGPPIPGPMLEQGYLDLDSPAFSLRLVRSSQTVAALKPKGAGDFDFTPGDLLTITTMKPNSATD